MDLGDICWQKNYVRVRQISRPGAKQSTAPNCRHRTDGTPWSWQWSNVGGKLNQSNDPEPVNASCGPHTSPIQNRLHLLPRPNTAKIGLVPKPPTERHLSAFNWTSTSKPFKRLFRTGRQILLINKEAFAFSLLTHHYSICIFNQSYKHYKENKRERERWWASWGHST